MLPRSYHKPFDPACPLCIPALFRVSDQKTSTVLLTAGYIKCSLGLLFSIVNFGHGTRYHATTRFRPASHNGIPRTPPPHHGRPARAYGSSLLARSSSQHPHRFGCFLVSQNSGLCRSRLPGRCRLHGPRQLGDRLGRRLKIRLHAS